MNWRIAFVGMLLVVSISASANEESIKFSDQKDQKRFVQILEQRQVPFRVSPDGQIFYPVEYREKVQDASEQINGQVNTEKEGVRVRPEQGEVVLKHLVENGINAEFMIPTDKTVILFPTAQSKKAMALVSEIMTQHGW